MDRLLRPSLLISLLLTGAIFGFFYSWVCSTMWGLDDIDARVAMESMQAMNASVRNPVFFVIFFLPPLATGLTAVVAWLNGSVLSSRLLTAATLLYMVGCMVLTTTINVPMNEALGATAVPADEAAAAEIWDAYSSRWQLFNTIRAVAAGICLGLVGWATLVSTRLTVPAARPVRTVKEAQHVPA